MTQADAWIGKKAYGYLDVVSAASDEQAFRSFRCQPAYQQIVETLTEDQGRAFFELVRDKKIRALCLGSEASDKIGNPLTFDYEGVQLSPVTLRYGKVLEDIASLFAGLDKMRSIAEIGVGFGGLARLIALYFRDAGHPLERYVGIDLEAVSNLATMYIKQTLDVPEVTFISSDAPVDGPFDLVISNYAFSELDRATQQDYLARVLLKSKSGYLTMNSGLSSGTRFKHDVFEVGELMNILPNAALLPDLPKTSDQNYIIVFGDHLVKDGLTIEELRASTTKPRRRRFWIF